MAEYIPDNQLAANTATPTTGSTSITVDSITKRLRTKDDSGLITDYAGQIMYNVKDYGCKVDGATDDLAAINTLISTTIPDASTIFIPSGTMRISGTITVPSGKHLRIIGNGANKTTIQTTSATLDMIVFSDWQQEVKDLSFSSSVTRTAGYGLNFGTNNIITVANCQFLGMYNGILHNGTIGIFDNNVFNNTVNWSQVFSGSAVNDVITRSTYDCSPASAAHINVVQCGSLIIDNCDIIHATNNMLINPVANGAFAIYCCDTYFDSAAGSSVKISGSSATGNVQRVKFVNCWFNSTASNGFECNGGATTLPTAIDFVNCDFFSNPTTGLLMTNVQDFSLVGSRIAGSTTGINISAASGAVTKPMISGCIIGPTAGIGANTTGILLNAGTYGQILIRDNNVQGNTTNISDSSSVTGFNQKQITNNLGHILNGLNYSRTATVAFTVNNDTVIGGGLNILPIPANSLKAGSSIRVTVYGSGTGTVTASAFEVHLGTAGTTADTKLFTASVTGAIGTSQFKGEIDITLLTVGASTTSTGNLSVIQAGATGIANASSTSIIGTMASVNTTVNNYLTVSLLSAAAGSSGTIQQCLIEVLA